MLKAFRGLSHSVGVHSAFMSESVSSHIGHTTRQFYVSYFSNIACGFGKLIRAPVRNTVVAQLQLKIRNKSRKIGVSAAFSYSYKCTLNVNRSRLNRRYAASYGTADIIVTVYTYGNTGGLDRLFGYTSDFIWKTASVCIAQHYQIRSCTFSGLKHRQCEFRTVLVAVKEVLRVKYNLTPVLFKKAQGISYHR